MEKEKRRTKETIVVSLDKRRRLKYSKDSYREILRNLQIPKGNGALVERKLNNLDIRYLSVFLWAGLNWEDPLLHLVKVENMLLQFEKDLIKLKKIEVAVVQALKLALSTIGEYSNN
ncbi:MAG: hypothetical protein OEZ45_15535 [Candidatus Aminicenantes bacterium]|nr:hypothetical protein [Candidatus Aminicenantes bacterium]